MENKKENSFLNVIKAICAILVVFIHCPFPGNLGIVVDVIARIGVPIFLMISGFYSYNNSKEKLMQKAKKIFKLMLYSYGIYIIIYMILNFISDGEICNYIKRIFNIKQLVKFILFNESIICIPLWYLSAVLYSYLIYYKLNKNIKIIYVFTPILLVIHIIVKEILFMYFDNEYSYLVRNFWLFGLPFFTLGHFINHYQEKIINSISNKQIIIFICLGIILAILERYVRFAKHFYIGTIISAILLFILTIKNPYYIHNRIIEKIGKSDYTFIYLWHKLFIQLVNHLHTNAKLWNYLKPIVVIILTVISSKIFNALRKILERKNQKKKEQY